MVKESITIWVCVDCLMLSANGDTPPHMDETETAEWLAGLNEDSHTATLGLALDAHETGCEIDADIFECTGVHECATQTFSWSRCDGCNSHLGGSRHAMTLELA